MAARRERRPRYRVARRRRDGGTRYRTGDACLARARAAPRPAAARSGGHERVGGRLAAVLRAREQGLHRRLDAVLGREGARVKNLFGGTLSRAGRFDLSAEPAFQNATAQYGFVSGKSTHANRLAIIRSTYQEHGLMIDTHTADGLKVAREHLLAGVPMIVLETALPIKFAETIVEALGQEPDRPAKFAGIEDLPKRVVNMPADVAQIKAYIERICA